MWFVSTVISIIIAIVIIVIGYEAYWYGRGRGWLE